MLKEDLINEDKEDMCLEIYGVRYYRLTQYERDLIDRMYIKRFNLERGNNGN